jgi:predicted GTPase
MTMPRLGSVTLASASAVGVEGGARLLKLAALADALGVNQLAGEARELASRVSEGRFYVACVGQFKRGKSTLINALVGEPVLPTGFVPVTAVPTVIRFGDRLKASIQTSDRRWREVAVSDLERYVSEEYNPENVEALAGVEVSVPSPLLAEGLCLVDTPGLGSVFAGNTASTHGFIPHIDATLVVTGADPPLAGEELALVEAAARHAPDLILVLNKADRTTHAERAAAASFARTVIERRLQRPVGPVFEVSASERLDNEGPARDWENLEAALERLVRQSGRQLIRAACERGVMRLSEHLLALIREEHEALQRPLEESERRIRALRETVAGAERSMRELAFLLMAEQQHLSDILGARHRAFLRSALPQAHQEFLQRLQSARLAIGPSYRRALMREAQDIASRQVLPWLGSEEEHAEEEYRQLARRFVQMGDDFLKRLATAGIPELSRLPHALDTEVGFRVRPQFSFQELIEVAQPASPLRWLADLILALPGARRVIEKNARQFLERLLEVNTTRVQSDILNRVQESRSRLEAEIRKLLQQIQRTSVEALAHAQRARAAGSAAVSTELLRLDALEADVRTMQASAAYGLQEGR